MNPQRNKRTLLTGIQPSGNLTIGNYIGAIKNYVRMQDGYDCLFLLADLHTITVEQDPAQLRRRCYDFLALYIACGIDPEKNVLFVQSHVPGHAQLAWILNCFTGIGELKRMTQFKDKASKNARNVNAGLFDYPDLMAADILLYQANLVPIGDDQKQHLELARTIARRLNSRFGAIVAVPEAHVPEIGARIMGLQDPTGKMSKTDENPANYIALLDSPDTIRQKIKTAVTDSGSEIVNRPDKPGIANLLTIYAAITDQPIATLEERYAGLGYGRFKRDLSESLIEFLEPIQRRHKELRTDEMLLRLTLRHGAFQAIERSQAILRKLHTGLGFIPS